MSWGRGWGCSPPRVGQNIFFSGNRAIFRATAKNGKNILKIINEKYEKYSIDYSKTKCPKSEHFGVRHSDWKSRC